jgi:hypothetical protein
MPWQQIGRRRYYYRSEWAGRPVRRYIGTGPVAELAAAADDLRKLKRAIATREREAKQARWQAALGPLLDLCSGTSLLIKATLLGAGYYQHSRSSLRKKQHAPYHVNSPTIGNRDP